MASTYNIHGLDNIVSHRGLDFNIPLAHKKKENANKRRYSCGNMYFSIKASYGDVQDDNMTKITLNPIFENFYEKGCVNFCINCLDFQKGINVTFFSYDDNIFRYNDAFCSFDFNNNNIH